MFDDAKARMFLSGKREIKESEFFRTYNSFNPADLQGENKPPYHRLYMFREVTLAAGMSIKDAVEKDTDFILLPITAAILLKDSYGKETIISSGEAELFNAVEGSSFEIMNPCENHLVNYLQIGIEKSAATDIAEEFCRFDLGKTKDSLIPLFSTGPNKGRPSVNLTIGKFSGRSEAVYEMSCSNYGSFIFVLEGAFEVQNRLLESRDGMALWNIRKMEMESLSNDAIIIIVEVTGAAQEVSG